MANRRLKSKALLAAPIIATALFAPACEPRVYRNPGPPEQPPPREVTPTNPGPPTEPQVAPTTEPDKPLADAPKDGEGRIEKQSDGTCLYIYPMPKKDCPVDATCNPGPPREPLHVKCP